MSLPQIASRDEWLAARTALLAKEKAMTRRRDALNAERRNLPMVEIDKPYVFEGPDGPASLLDLFEDRRQLIVGHFMFDPSWDDGCPSCSAGADAPVEYNYRSAEEHARAGATFFTDAAQQPFEMPGASYFLRDGERVFHTYSTFARGAEQTGGSYYFLDLTALGRQEEWEEPEGRAAAAHAARPDFAE